MLTEIAKFDQDEPACIIASTDLDCPDEGANYVDGAGVYGVHDKDGEGTLYIVCSDNGTLTWAQLAQRIWDYRNVKDLDTPARVKIGYGCGPRAKSLTDFNDEPVPGRAVLNCTVLKDDTIWNITLEAR